MVAEKFEGVVKESDFAIEEDELGSPNDGGTF